VGAVASFIGLVRDVNEGDGVATLSLEHYPGMTEKALTRIVDAARARWNLFDVTLIHHVGELRPTDPIMLVAVASAHRGEAFIPGFDLSQLLASLCSPRAADLFRLSIL
jgi:molybdopterin synthase catalytic subunit